MTAMLECHMRAAVYRSGAFVVDEIPDPQPRDGQVLLEIEATGICGSDLSAARHIDLFLQSARDSGTSLYSFDPDKDLVFGHEYAGRVIMTGAGVENVSVDDLVAGYAIVNDAEGVTRLCGYSNEHTGGFAQRMVVQATSVHRVPAGVTAAAATLAEPFSVGETSVQRSQLNPEHGAVVMGAGSIGLGVIAALSARGAQHVIAVEPSPRRREMAVQMGAALALQPDEANPVEIWRQKAGAQVPLVVWECTGKAGMLNKIMHLVPPQTRIMVDGSCMVDDTIRPIVGTYKGLLIDFGYGPVTDAYAISLDRIGTGAVDALSLITAEVGLDDVGTAFDWLSNPNEHVKIIVRPELTQTPGTP